MSTSRAITVYCGANDGHNPAYRAAAYELGRHLAERGIRLIYGGGSTGLMGVLADAVLGSGGEVTGVIPSFMQDKEYIHRGLDELHVRASMHERKATMLDLADGVIALPGGIGTLEELIEAMTWTQLGIHGIPCGLLDADGFWNPFMQMLDHCVTEGFVTEMTRNLVIRSSDPAWLVDALIGTRPPS